MPLVEEFFAFHAKRLKTSKTPRVLAWKKGEVRIGMRDKASFCLDFLVTFAAMPKVIE